MATSGIAFGGRKVSDIWALHQKHRADKARAAAQQNVVGSGRPNAHFPVPFKTFAASLQGTVDEVWVKLLKKHHGTKTQLHADWHNTLTSVKGA